MLTSALRDEEDAEREADRRYCAPLERDLDQLRARRIQSASRSDVS